MLPHTIAIDSTDHLVLAGSFSGTLTIGNDLLESEGDDDAFVAKRPLPSR